MSMWGGIRIFNRQNTGNGNGTSPHAAAEASQQHRIHKFDVTVERYPNEVQVKFAGTKYDDAHDLFSEMLAMAFIEKKMVATNALFPFGDKKTGHIIHAEQH